MAWSDALAAQPTAMLRQRALLQLAYAAVHALRGDPSSNWDALHLQERQLTAAAAQGVHAAKVDFLLKTVSLASLDCNNGCMGRSSNGLHLLLRAQTLCHRPVDFLLALRWNVL